MSEAYESNYHIAQGENVQGPYTYTKLMELIAQGRARPEMLFSRDGADWVEGFDCPELFAESEPAEVPLGAPAAAPAPGLGDNPGLHRRGSGRRVGGGRDGGRRDGGGRTSRRGRVEPHRGTAIFVLGLLGLVMSCGIFGVIAWVMANPDLEKMRAGRMDRSGEGLTVAGKILGIISVVLMLLVVVWILFLGGLAASGTLQSSP